MLLQTDKRFIKTKNVYLFDTLILKNGYFYIKFYNIVRIII